MDETLINDDQRLKTLIELREINNKIYLDGLEIQKIGKSIKDWGIHMNLSFILIDLIIYLNGNVDFSEVENENNFNKKITEKELDLIQRIKSNIESCYRIYNDKDCGKFKK